MKNGLKSKKISKIKIMYDLFLIFLKVVDIFLHHSQKLVKIRLCHRKSRSLRGTTLSHDSFYSDTMPNIPETLSLLLRRCICIGSFFLVFCRNIGNIIGLYIYINYLVFFRSLHIKTCHCNLLYRIQIHALLKLENFLACC